MELALFALWCFVVAAAGGVAGLVLGNIRLPATLLVTSSAAAGGGANLLISAAAAGAASVSHIRAGNVNWHLFAWMAPPSVAGAVLGGYLAGLIDEDVLLVCIAVVLLYSGIDLLRWRPRVAPAGEPAAREPGRREFNRPTAVLSGAVIGVLGGLVGLILGTLRMPALLRFVGEPVRRAVGTNLTVGVCVGIAGALGHLPSVAPDWRIAAVGAAASIPGAVIGARLTGRLSELQLLHAIGAILLVAATVMALQAILA